MRRLIVVFWAVVCSCLLVLGACGDDTSSTPSQDDQGQPDVAADTGADTSPDMGPDMVEDAEPDLPPLEEGCQASDCTAPQACVGGACVDPVDDLEGYAEDAADRPSSYWWALQLPALFEPQERCCFDYTNDGVEDDNLGGIIGALAGFLGDGELDVQATIDESIDDGTLTLVNDWRMLPEGDGDVQFSVFLGTNDTDGDDVPNNTAEEREAGDGAYLIDERSFGDHGALVQYNVGSKSSGVLFAGPSTFELALTIAALGTEPLSLTLLDTRLRAPISIEENGVHTQDEDRDGFIVGGGELGGVVDGGQLLGILDGCPAEGCPAEGPNAIGFRNCTCAGIDPEEPVLQWEYDVDGGTLAVSCNPDNTGTTGGDCTADDGPLCANVTTACGFIGFVGGFLDVDRLDCLDGDEVVDCQPGQDGIGDALSAGLRFGWTGASIDGLFTAPEETP